MNRVEHDTIVRFVLFVLFLAFATGVALAADGGEKNPFDCWHGHCDCESPDELGVLVPMSPLPPLASARAPEQLAIEAPADLASLIFHPPMFL